MAQLPQTVGIGRTVVLMPITTFSAAATTNGTAVTLETGYKSARFHLKADGGVGTSPTLNVYIQTAIATAGATDVAADPATGALAWTDICAFAQSTTAATDQYYVVYPNAAATFAATAATLTAGTNTSGPIGRTFRATVKVGGTSPQFANVQVVAEFLPW